MMGRKWEEQEMVERNKETKRHKRKRGLKR